MEEKEEVMQMLTARVPEVTMKKLKVYCAVNGLAIQDAVDKFINLGTVGITIDNVVTYEKSE